MPPEAEPTHRARGQPDRLAGQVRPAAGVAQARPEDQRESGGQTAEAGRSQCDRALAADQRCRVAQRTAGTGELQHRNSATGNRMYQFASKDPAQSLIRSLSHAPLNRNATSPTWRWPSSCFSASPTASWRSVSPRYGRRFASFRLNPIAKVNYARVFFVAASAEHPEKGLAIRTAGHAFALGLGGQHERLRHADGQRVPHSARVRQPHVRVPAEASTLLER